MRDLAERVALVTGGSRGIGAAVVKRLAHDGTRVVVNYARDAEAAQSVVAEVAAAGGEAVALQADLSEVEAARRLVAEAAGIWGRLDILVNNAGVAEMLPLEQATPEHLERVWSVNVRGLLLTTQEAVRHFGAGGGRIINLSSGAVQAAPPGMSVYSASKAAVETLTRTFAAELGPRGVTVNAVSPGLTETDMLRQALTPEYRAQMIARTPLRRLGQPEDVADVVAFLASDDARWITGAILPVSGGLR